MAPDDNVGDLPDIVLATWVIIAQSGIHKHTCASLPDYCASVLDRNYGSVLVLSN